jgi:DNA-binding ferritin-like protein
MDEKLSKAVMALADVCAASAGDLHTLHLNYKGAEFDMMHKKVLKKYYEQLDSDYDDLAEWGRCFDITALNKNEAASRIEYQSYNGNCDRQHAIEITHVVLDNVATVMREVFNYTNKIEDCYICIGLSNWLQTRLEYWAKEIAFFNKYRLEGGI